MPPHCDTKDGPVVAAARKALEVHDVDRILPFVKKDGENEVREAFEKVNRVHENVIACGDVGELATEIADEWFFETVVRVHRAGEGAPYTGLKPAGLSEGPVIPVAEKAIETGSAEALIETLTTMLRDEVQEKFRQMMQRKEHSGRSVDDAREYVEAMLGLQVWSHKLYLAIKSDLHKHTGSGSHSEDHAH